MHSHVSFSTIIAIILATQYTLSSPVPIRILTIHEDLKNDEIKTSLKAQELHQRALFDNEISYDEIPIELLQPGSIDQKETILSSRPSLRDAVHMEQLNTRPNTAGELIGTESVPRNEFDEHKHSESNISAENQTFLSDKSHHHDKRSLLNRTPGGVYGRGVVPLGMYPGSEFIPGYNYGMQPGLGNEFLYPHQGSGNFGFGYGGFLY